MNEYLLFGIFVVVSVFAGVWLMSVVRACNKRRLLTETRGAICDMSGGVGVSILCGRAYDIVWIERLLSEEYVCCEVIIVLDACEKPALFEELYRRYHLFRGGAIPVSEVTTSEIRALYRSRSRCYRRLVLVDALQCSVEMAWNTALTVASYDYLLPLFGREELLSGTILRLVAEVGEVEQNEKRLICTAIGEPIILVSREAVVSAGGFETHWTRTIPRRYRVTLWEPMTRGNDCRRQKGAFQTVITLAMVAAIVVAIGLEVWWLAAMGATLLWIRAVTIYAKAMIIETIETECR